jgi:outer membrane immunogenic protein
MRRLTLALISAVSVIAFTQMASSADLGRPAYQAPPQPPAPLFSWTGFYIGGSLGARFTDITWTTTAIGSPLGPPDPTTSPVSVFDSSSFRGGGYVGYNWQFSPLWVAGIEGDLAWADNSKTLGGIPGTFGTGGEGVGPGAAALDSSQVKLGWDGSIRGRIGYLIMPTFLLYATGGAAWQHVDINASCNGSPTNDSWCVAVRNESASAVQTGWTVGGGIEAAIWGNWLARVEYRYADFGDINHTFFAGTVDQVVTSVSLKTHTILGGLAYKF